MKFDPTYDGPVQGFQLWINLKSANKLDPPEFQNAAPTPCRWSTWPWCSGEGPARRAQRPGVARRDAGHPLSTVDYELEAGSEATHPARRA